MLINTGVYKDRNTAEPALASLIQRDIGANLGHPPRPGHHGTFSFDVLNGGCGVITAAQLLDGFLGGGAARFGMIVAGDADPHPRTSRGFPFAPAGGAVLFAHDDGGDTGFDRFAIRTFPEHAGMFEAHLDFDPDAGFLARGSNVIEVYEAPAFAIHCVDHAADVATEVLASAGLLPGDIDLVIASQYPRTFAIDVVRRLGISEQSLPRVRGALLATHTAGPIAALEAAIGTGKLARARHVLFVTAGAGITIGVALYHATRRVGIDLAPLDRMTTTESPSWDDVRRIADELELKIHLAGMDARDRWRELQPRFAELEKTIASTGERAGQIVSKQITAVGTALKQLRDELADEFRNKA
jgi:3-oxoacyl-[acyl-carrier-protein] synthase-3